MRYPRSRPLSNHLLTVRGATLQILATWPVVKIVFIAGSPIASLLIAEGVRAFRKLHPLGVGRLS